MSTSVRSLLQSDPVWTVFALADLHPRFAQVCRWTVMDSAVILFWAGITPPILITHGPAAEVEAALAKTDLPERVYLSVREEHLPAIQRWYDTSVDYRPMWRMVAPLTPQLWGERPQPPPKLGAGGRWSISARRTRGGSRNFSPTVATSPRMRSTRPSWPMAFSGAWKLGTT